MSQDQPEGPSLPEPTVDQADRDDSRSRRGFFGAILAGGIAAAAHFLGDDDRPAKGWTLRPPGALAEDDFLSTCTRCFKCGNACPNDCIAFHELGDGLKRAWTPYIKARDRGCILCGDCADVCPTGALQPFVATRDGWLDAVAMGTARVNKEMCFSFNGRTCGACYQACPLAGVAITIGVFEQPTIHPDHCVGCGLCEQACLHLPQAVRVIPNRRGKTA